MDPLFVVVTILLVLGIVLLLGKIFNIEDEYSSGKDKDSPSEIVLSMPICQEKYGTPTTIVDGQRRVIRGWINGQPVLEYPYKEVPTVNTSVGKGPFVGAGGISTVSGTGGAGGGSTSGYCRIIGTPEEEFRLRLDQILHEMWYEINCCLDDNSLPLVNPEVNFVSRKKLEAMLNQQKSNFVRPHVALNFQRVPDHLIPSSGLKNGVYELKGGIFTKIN